MTRRKALFVDLDGTLFDKHNGIPKSTIDALNHLLPDVDLYLATGRSSYTLAVIEEIIPLFKGLLLLNGQHVMVNHKTIFYNTMKKEHLLKLHETAVKYQAPIGYVTIDKAYVYSYSEDIHKFFSERSNDRIVDCEKEGFDFTAPVSMVWLFADTVVVDAMERELPELSFLKWGRFGCDIVEKGESKQRGVKVIQDTFGYLTEDMYAIGNGDNDIEMFQAVGTAVAMGNSSDHVKENAHLVTSALSEDGIFKALKQLGLLDV